MMASTSTSSCRETQWRPVRCSPWYESRSVRVGGAELLVFKLFVYGAAFMFGVACTSLPPVQGSQEHADSTTRDASIDKAPSASSPAVGDPVRVDAADSGAAGSSTPVMSMGPVAGSPAMSSVPSMPAGDPPASSCIERCEAEGAYRCLEGKASMCVSDATGCRRWRPRTKCTASPCNVSASPCASGSCWDDMRCAKITEGQWNAGTDNYDPMDSAIGPDGSVWVVGIQGAAGGPDQQGFLSKWSSSGQQLWSRVIATPGSDWVRGVAVTRDGRVVIAGETEGAFQGTNRGATDAFATMFPANVDATTPPIWTVQSGGGSNDGFASIAIRGDGVLIAGGVTWRATTADAGASSEPRAWVVALAAADGHLVWTRDWSNALDPELFRVATDGDDAYALGHYNFKDKLSHHAFVTRLDSLGNLAWEALLPIEMTTQAARSSAIDLTAADGRVVAAYLAVDSTRVVALDAQKKVSFEQSTALCSGGVATGKNGSLVCTEAKGAATTRLHVDAAGLATLGSLPVSGTGVAAAETPSELIVVRRTDVRNPGPGLVPRIWFLQPSLDE